MGGRGTDGIGHSSTAVTEDDWFDWAADPEPYKSVIRGQKQPTISQADGHKYTQEELDRAKKIAPKIQELAEATTVEDHTLYRGESYDSLLEAKRKYRIGKTITNDTLTSYTRKSHIAEGYASGNIEFMEKGAVGVVITNTNVNNKVSGSVGTMTNPLGAGGSDEIVTPKGMKSKVVSTHYDKDSNILYVTLQNRAAPKKKK